MLRRAPQRRQRPDSHHGAPQSSSVIQGVQSWSQRHGRADATRGGVSLVLGSDIASVISTESSFALSPSSGRSFEGNFPLPGALDDVKPSIFVPLPGGSPLDRADGASVGQLDPEPVALADEDRVEGAAPVLDGVGGQPPTRRSLPGTRSSTGRVPWSRTPELTPPRSGTVGIAGERWGPPISRHRRSARRPRYPSGTPGTHGSFPTATPEGGAEKGHPVELSSSSCHLDRALFLPTTGRSAAVPPAEVRPICSGRIANEEPSGSLACRSWSTGAKGAEVVEPKPVRYRNGRLLLLSAPRFCWTPHRPAPGCALPAD